MFYLKRNVPGWERIVRIMMAAGLGAAAFLGNVTGPVQIGLIVMAAMALMTGVLGYCPACAMAGRKHIE